MPRHIEYLLPSIKGYLGRTRPERPKHGFVSYAWEQDAEKYGIAVMAPMVKAPTLEDIPELPFRAAYIRVRVNSKEKLYYLYYKDENQAPLIDITPKKADKLKELDAALSIGTSCQHKLLERRDLQIINDLTSHNQMERNKELQAWIKTLQEDLQTAALEEVFLDIKNMHGELKTTMRTNIQQSGIIFFICNQRFKERFAEASNCGLVVISEPPTADSIKALELPYTNAYIRMQNAADQELYYKNAWGVSRIEVAADKLRELDAIVTLSAAHRLLSIQELSTISAITNHAHNNLVFEVHTVLHEKQSRPSLQVMLLLQSGALETSVPQELQHFSLVDLTGAYSKKKLTGFREAGLLDKVFDLEREVEYKQILYRHYLSELPITPKLFGREDELEMLGQQIAKERLSFLVGEVGVGTSALATHFANKVHLPPSRAEERHYPLVRYLNVSSQEEWGKLVTAFAEELEVDSSKWWEALLNLPTKWLIVIDSGSVRIGWEPTFKDTLYQQRLLRVQNVIIESPKVIRLAPLLDVARTQIIKYYLGSHDSEAEQKLIIKYSGSLQELIQAIKYIKISPWLNMARFLKYELDVPSEPVKLTRQRAKQEIRNEPDIRDEDVLEQAITTAKWPVLKAGVKQLVTARALTVGILYTEQDRDIAEKLKVDAQDCGIHTRLLQNAPFPPMNALIIVATPNFKTNCSKSLEVAITALKGDARSVYPVIASGDFSSAVPQFLTAYLIANYKDGYEKVLLGLEPLGIISAICGFHEGYHDYEHYWHNYCFSNLPERDPRLVGRTQTLAEIKRLLEAPNEGAEEAKLVAITATGGFGKSSVALMYGHKYQDNYDLIRVINSEGTALLNSLVSLASDLCIEIRGKRITEVLPLLYARLAKINRYLLIFDNVEKFADIKDYLPPISRVGQHLVVTSRDNNGWPHKVEFTVFTPEESNEYLRNELKEESDELGKELGYLPLALNTAVAFIRQKRREGHYSMDDYLHDYSEGVAVGGNDAVKASLKLSLPKIEQKSPDALRILRYCAFLAPERIAPEWFAYAGLLLEESVSLEEESQTMQGRQVVPAKAMVRIYAGLAVTANFSLLTVKDYELFIHRLMQETLRPSIVTGEIEPQRLFNEYLAPLQKSLCALYPKKERTSDAFALRKQLIPHLESLIKHFAVLELPESQ